MPEIEEQDLAQMLKDNQELSIRDGDSKGNQRKSRGDIKMKLPFRWLIAIVSVGLIWLLGYFTSWYLPF